MIFQVFFSLYNKNSVSAFFEVFNGSNLNLYMSTIICARLFTAVTFRLAVRYLSKTEAGSRVLQQTHTACWPSSFNGK